MVWHKINLKKQQHDYDGLSFRSGGLSWNSRFIKNNRLEKHTHVEFHRDDDNPYLLGFTFHHEATEASLALQKAGRDTNSMGRTVKATALKNANSLIAAECKSNNDPFEISYDKHHKIFFVELRPNFSNKIKLTDVNSLPKEIKGIYRYLDDDKSIIYIGKGAIRARAQQDDRKDWDIKFIEYEVIESDDEAYKWESYYINEFRQNTGYLPTFNRVAGHSTG
ncbi:MAG: hypothetical protein VW270_24310 [Candidatus Poseidoniales archaeon]